MTPKRPLAVGDRVCVYSGPTSFKGTVKSLDGGNKHIDGAQDIAIDRDDPSGSIAYVHPKQCRRIKVKPKKPVEEKRERLSYWLPLSDQLKIAKSGAMYAEGLTLYKDPRKTAFHLVELFPGEVPIDRKRLAEIWDKVFCNVPGSGIVSENFIKLAKLLFPEDTK